MTVKVELRMGDAMVLIKEIGDGAIDLVLCDPPFNVNLEYGEHYDDDQLDFDYVKWVEKWIKQCHRVIKPTGAILVFSSPKHIREYLEALNKAGFTYKDTLIWNKINAHRAFGRQPLPQYEPCYWCVKGKDYTFNKVGLANVLNYSVIHPHNKERVEGNPAQRPVAMYRKLIEVFSKEGDTVLDPFVGSGTTLLACRMAGRNGIGFELNPKLKRVIETRALLNVSALSDFDGRIDNY